MASRKDKKGRVLRKGESFNEAKQRYLYTYTDSHGKRRSVYATDLVELRKKEEQLKKDQLDGIDTYVAGNADLNFLFDRYMTTKNELRVSTKSNYYEVYDRYVRDDFGKRKIGSIKYSDILFFYNHLMCDLDLHIGTVQYVQRLIRPSLEMAVRDNIIRTNPANGIIQQLKKFPVKKSSARHALTLEQQRAVLSYLDETPEYNKWKPLFTVMVGTGMRVGELVGLRWEDIDMDARTIDINHSLFYFAGRRNKEPNKWVVNLPKTESGIRNIPMVDTVHTAFMEEKSRQDEENTSCLSVVEDMSGFIFCNRFREVYVPESINRNLRRVIENYNVSEEVRAVKEKREAVLLPHFSCHHLRHTFCARLCEADVNIKVIQSIMGHKDIQTTMDIYAEVTGDKKKKSLDEIFNQMKLF